jgi:hypothetical protein
MNVFQKLNEARSRFHKKALKKSGHNKFAGYNYFELADFIVPALEIFNEVGLISIVRFGKEQAELFIVNVEKPEEQIVFSSPMSEANLKGCHPVQNLGAVQTYISRYLWTQVLLLIEHDMLDSTTGSDRPKHSPTKGAVVSDKRQSMIVDVSIAVIERFEADDIIGMMDEYSGITDEEEKIALWALLPSNIRSTIKKQPKEI